MATRQAGWKGRFPDWYGDFFKAHVTRCHRGDWPTPGTPAWPTFFEPWAQELAALDATPEEARAASFHLAKFPPAYLSDHLKALVERVEQARRAGANPLSERQQAEAASRDCPECGGAGLASREHDVPDRGRIWFSYICICPLGRWIKGQHDRDPKGPRLRDLAHHPALQARGEPIHDPRAEAIADWFVARREARRRGWPDPPEPEIVAELRRASRERNRPAAPTRTPRTRTRAEEAADDADAPTR